MCLVKCLKKLVSEHFATVNMLSSLKTCTAALPSHFCIILAKIELENIRLSVSEILKVFVNTLNASEQYSLRNRKKLPQPVQLQLCKKQIFFLNFLLHI